jgi:GNAT superfamily N-acetyltransferase
MEDIYVSPEFRKHGIGKQLFLENVKFADSTNCSRFDFHVLNWNPAKGFYQKLGAQNLTEKEGWEFFRLTKPQMNELLK